MNLRSLNEVSHFNFIISKFNLPCTVLGSYGLLILNSIIVILSLAMVSGMAKCLCKLVTTVALNPNRSGSLYTVSLLTNKRM